jgi:mannose-6-phosphate isomerase-like protein (cupin superfamily)
MAAPTKTAPHAQVFSLRTPLLSAGRSNLEVAATDLLKLRVKVYAEGGENGLHTHLDEDHAFVVLQGQATFHDEHGTDTVVNKYEGIMLPRGAYYHFTSTGDENLVLVRVGAGRKAEGNFRLGTHGRPLTAEENGNVKPVPIPGQFFGE